MGRNGDRSQFDDHQRIVLLEQDEDRADARHDDLREAVKWYTRSAVGILVAIVGGSVILYLQTKGAAP